VRGTGVFLTGTGAPRESLAWKVREGVLVVPVAWIEGDIWYPIPGLVDNSTDIA